jgi:hypothetical protein
VRAGFVEDATVVEHEPVPLYLAEVNPTAVNDAPELPPRTLEHVHRGSTRPPVTENAIENT